MSAEEIRRKAFIECYALAASIAKAYTGDPCWTKGPVCQLEAAGATAVALAIKSAGGLSDSEIR